MYAIRSYYAFVGADGFDHQSVIDKFLTGARNMPEIIKYKAADSLVVVIFGNQIIIKRLIDIAYMDMPVNENMVARKSYNFV